MNAPADFTLRHDWTVDEIVAIHDAPLLELVARASAEHRRFFDPNDVQKAALLSIKTGGCPEDCSYCPQAAHHRGSSQPRRLMGVNDVLEAAGPRARQEPSVLHGCGLARSEGGPRI